MTNTDTIEIAVANETRPSSVAWGAVIAGAVSAAALSLILALLGAALGFAVVSPWSSPGEIATTLAVGTVIWLIVMQWLSAGLGGFVTGRLRVRWSASGDEVFFRDTVHGFLAWALATLIVVGIAGSTVSAVVGTGAQVAGSVAGAAVQGAAEGVASDGAGSSIDPTPYFVDLLFRPADFDTSPEAATAPTPDATPAPPPEATTAPADTDADTGVQAAPAAPAPASPPGIQAAPVGTTAGASDAVRAETGRLLLAGLTAEEFPADDRAYLVQLVGGETGLSQEEAEARVDAVLARAETLKEQAAALADEARHVAAQMSFFLFLSLLIGAFIASVAAALGGNMRDDPSGMTTR